MLVYYNEIDPYCVRWLRNLIYAGLLPFGIVDDRSIEDVTPQDLRGFGACHFFAGLGGWPLALQLAGWPHEKKIWTGSCPCQPFSAAGKGGGFADERHLWPMWHWLIGQCRPDLVLGEQVEGPAGRAWLDLVATDLEGHGYAFGTAVFPAAGVGAPQIRHRTYWAARRMAGAMQSGRAERWAESGDRQIARSGGAGGVDSAASPRHVGALGGAEGASWDEARLRLLGEGRATGRPSPVNGFWRASDWLYCRGDKWRPVEPGTFPLASGAPARVGRLRAYGNAICVPQAVAFLKCLL